MAFNGTHSLIFMFSRSRAMANSGSKISAAKLRVLGVEDEPGLGLLVVEVLQDLDCKAVYI